jgi:hypothetical protein
MEDEFNVITKTSPDKNIVNKQEFKPQQKDDRSQPIVNNKKDDIDTAVNSLDEND